MEIGETLWDDKVKCLHARRGKRGVVFFLFYRTRSGKQRRPKIGTLSNDTVDLVRKRARNIMARVYLGEDPKGMWDKSREDITVSPLFELVWEEYWNKPQFITTGWNSKVQSLCNKYVLPKFGETKLSDLCHQVINDWHQSLKHTNPSAGNHCLSCLSTMLRFARDRGLVSYNACDTVKHYTLPSRNRFATGNELTKILDILNEIIIDPESSDHTGALFLYTILYTGARPTSISRGDFSKVQIVDQGGKLYGIYEFSGKSTNKSAQKEKIILPADLINKYYDTGSHPFGSKMPRRLWAYIQEEIDAPDLWIRDLRRTFATIGLSSGIGLDVVGELLNHKNKQTTSIYAKLIDDVRVSAVENIADELQKLRGD